MTNSKVKQVDILQQTHTTTGTASAYELNIPKLDTLTDEQVFFVQFHITNNATASLNINSLGAVAITTSEWNAIWAGDLKTTGRYTLVYDADTASFIVSEMVDSEVIEIVTPLTWTIIGGSTFNPYTHAGVSLPNVGWPFWLLYTITCNVSGTYTIVLQWCSSNEWNTRVVLNGVTLLETHSTYDDSGNFALVAWDILQVEWYRDHTEAAYWWWTSISFTLDYSWNFT